MIPQTARRNWRGYRIGESHQRAKLTDAEVNAMRARYVPGKIGYGTLAKEFGCGESTARDIVNHYTRQEMPTSPSRSIAP